MQEAPGDGPDNYCLTGTPAGKIIDDVSQTLMGKMWAEMQANAAQMKRVK